MLPTSGRPTKPRGQASGPRKRFSWEAFSIGVVSGMILVAAVGCGILYYFGFFTPVAPTTPAPLECPATPDLVVICPQVVPPVVVTATPGPTLTPTPTPTPHLAATATAACATFQSRFPATPCP